MTDRRTAILARVLYDTLFTCPLKHDPKYKSYVPQDQCPLLARIREQVPTILATMEKW